MPRHFCIKEQVFFLFVGSDSITFLNSSPLSSVSFSSLLSFARRFREQKVLKNGRPRPRGFYDARAVLCRERRRRPVAGRDEAGDGESVVDRWRRCRRRLRWRLRLAPVDPLRPFLPASGGEADKGAGQWWRLIVDQRILERARKRDSFQERGDSERLKFFLPTPLPPPSLLAFGLLPCLPSPSSLTGATAALLLRKEGTTTS